MKFPVITLRLSLEVRDAMNHYDGYVCDGRESTWFSAGGVLGIPRFTIVDVYSQTAAIALMV